MTAPGSVSLPSEFDDLEVGITLHDPETGAILDVNGRLEELYGYSAEELRSMDVGDYSPAEPGYARRVAKERVRAAAAGKVQVFEWRVERGNGELVWVRVRLNVTTIDGVECVFAEIRDITEYKARERRLRLLNRVIRHNLRNDTNVLLGHAERLRDAIESDALLEDVETIREVTREIGRLSESVRQIEEIADPSVTERVPTDVGAVVEAVASDARERHPPADVSVEIQTDVWVNADVGLEYALDHAVRNAIEHNDAPEPSVTVTVDAGTESGRAYVAIADDGPAIPDIEIEALDADTDTTSTTHGAGVGLWVMQSCVDALGGQLSFEANEPRGNVVRFSLPATEPPAGEDVSE